MLKNLHTHILSGKNPAHRTTKYVSMHTYFAGLEKLANKNKQLKIMPKQYPTIIIFMHYFMHSTHQSIQS